MDSVVNRCENTSPRRKAQKFEARRSPTKKTVRLTHQRKVKIYEFKTSYLRKHSKEHSPLARRAYQAELTAFLHHYDSQITGAVVCRWIKAHLWITVEGMNGGMEQFVIQIDPASPSTTTASESVNSGQGLSTRRRSTPSTNGYEASEVGEQNIDSLPLDLREQHDRSHIRAGTTETVYRGIGHASSAPSAFPTSSDTPIPSAPYNTRTSTPLLTRTPMTSAIYSVRPGTPVPVSRYNIGSSLTALPQYIRPAHSPNHLYQSFEQPRPCPSSRFYEPTPTNSTSATLEQISGSGLGCHVYFNGGGGSSHLAQSGHYQPRSGYFEHSYPNTFPYANGLPTPYFSEVRRTGVQSTAAGEHNGSVSSENGYSSRNRAATASCSSNSQLSNSEMSKMIELMRSVILNPRESIGSETLQDTHARLSYTLKCMIQLSRTIPTLKLCAVELGRCSKVLKRLVKKENAPVTHLEAFRLQCPTMHTIKEERAQTDDDSSPAYVDC